MIEVYPNLYVGTADDYETTVKGNNEWCVVHACKEPYHRQTLGYTTRAVSNKHPEYLFAVRDNRLVLNMIDADTPKYIPKEIVDKSIEFIKQGLSDNKKVLVHCNQGMSRSPSLAMLYMAMHTDAFNDNTINAVETEFAKIYPLYNPSNGIRSYLIQNWDNYMNNGATK